VAIVDNTRKAVLSAIEKLGHRVSAADVAAGTGLSLADSRIALNRIALETRAVLEVSAGGQIAYRFFPDLESVYRLAGLRKLLSKAGSLALTAAFYLLKVSFGILLLASFLTITLVFLVALIFILCGIGAANAADGKLPNAGGISFHFFDFGDLLTFFSWTVMAGPRAPAIPDYYSQQVEIEDRGFFQNCFSFLFGDGNPNSELSEKQWRLIAECIRRNHGVVTAEQLSPYLLRPQADCRAMLEVMVRFEGTPEVTPSGNIVYCFPSLQVTASALQNLMEMPDKIQEKEWKFSTVPTGELHWVFFFAGANLCGAYALNQHLAWFQPLLPYAAQINLMLAYAVFFMCFPICRQITNAVRNALIETRNQERARSVAGLAGQDCLRRISEARQFAVRAINLRSQPVVYTTGRSLLDQDPDGLAGQFEQMQQNNNTRQIEDKDKENPPQC
jgi:hypothetical protein